MDQIPDEISTIIDLFLEELQKNNINIEQAILFGSYAQGTYTSWSDIDLALVSSDFEKRSIQRTFHFSCNSSW